MTRRFDRLDLDYPITPRVRWGHGLAPHPELAKLIGAHRDTFADLLNRFLTYRTDLERICVRDDGGSTDVATWVNWYLGGIDCLALYGFIRAHDPARYMEIGSGVSTAFAARAISDGGLRTSITSIDPQPRADIDALCSTTIREPLEDCDAAIFDVLQPGDILFFDGSHRVFMNSDATVFFLEVLPRLRPGVLVHIHDVFLPEDYLPDWTDRHYSEQYLLAAWLLGGGESVEVLFPSWFVHRDPELGAIAGPLWNALGLGPEEYRGCSFWVRTVAREHAVARSAARA